MKQDLRQSTLYREAEALVRCFHQPGSGLISDVAEVSSDGEIIVFSGVLADSLEGNPCTRICLADVATGDTRVLTFGPNSDRSPVLSPDGRQIAFLSDRRIRGEFQLYLLDVSSRETRSAAAVEGCAEYVRWSPAGKQILLGSASHRMDIGELNGGAACGHRDEESLPKWMPYVKSGTGDDLWRSTWVYDIPSGAARRTSPGDMNVWEAAWCGSRAVAVVASSGRSEGSWYSSRLFLLDTDDGSARQLYVPSTELGGPVQIGCPSASPSGRHLALIEAICSDRGSVAGDLVLIDIASGAVQKIDTHGIDVTCTEWRSDRHLLLAGHRGLDTVVGLFDLSGSNFTVIWCSQEITTGGAYATVRGICEPGDCVLIAEGFSLAPELAVIRNGVYRRVRSFSLGSREPLKALAAAEAVRWVAPDGLEIEGWLLNPGGTAPHPLITAIHGGPVYHWRPRWLGRRVANLMLLRRGYAVLMPNPRGSSGRGREFVRLVMGDMGGADVRDCLSGIDHLVSEGIVDPNRLGLTGLSYGGFMTCWLVTQDARFAAAVAVSPIANQVTAHLLSDLGPWMSWFLNDRYNSPNGRYFQLSPIMHAHNARAPTLIISGRLDGCTPPEEAVQIHHALLENGVKSVLVEYPLEGHGVRNWPAVCDFSARVITWFEEHIPISATVE